MFTYQTDQRDRHKALEEFRAIYHTADPGDRAVIEMPNKSFEVCYSEVAKTWLIC